MADPSAAPSPILGVHRKEARLRRPLYTSNWLSIPSCSARWRMCSRAAASASVRGRAAPRVPPSSYPPIAPPCCCSNSAAKRTRGPGPSTGGCRVGLMWRGPSLPPCCMSRLVVAADTSPVGVRPLSCGPLQPSERAMDMDTASSSAFRTASVERIQLSGWVQEAVKRCQHNTVARPMPRRQSTAANAGALPVTDRAPDLRECGLTSTRCGYHAAATAAAAAAPDGEQVGRVLAAGFELRTWPPHAATVS
jgi:hypothetical protein